jgi:hypothetical protein
MTSTHCQSVALGRIIAPWAVKIAEFFGTIVKIILTIVENVRNSLHELGTCWAGMSGCRALSPRSLAQAHRHPGPAMTPQDTCSLPISGRRRRGSPTPPCRRPDAGEKLMDFEAPEAHHTGSERRSDPT